MKKIAICQTASQKSFAEKFEKGTSATLVADPSDPYALQGTSKQNPLSVKGKVGEAEAQRTGLKVGTEFELHVTSSGTLGVDGNEGVFEALGTCKKNGRIAIPHVAALVLEVSEVTGAEQGSW